MATYDHFKREYPRVQAPVFGSFWMFAEIDFATWPAAQNDIYRLFKIRDGWIIGESYTRIKTATDLGSDWEVGINGGTEIVDLSNPAAVTDWVAGTITRAAPRLVGSDNEFVTVQVTDAAETKGKLQVMIEVIADPTMAEPAEMDHS